MRAPLLLVLLSIPLLAPALAVDAARLTEVRTLLRSGKYPEAEASCRKLLPEVEAESGPDSMEAAKVIDLLVEAVGAQRRRKDPEQLALAERALAIREKKLGPDHLDVATSVNNLANVVADGGDNAAALPLYERALAIREKALGPEDPAVATSLNNLGIVRKDLLDWEGARVLYERALAIRVKKLGPDHPAVGVTLFCLGNLYLETGEYALARVNYERALAIREKALGPDHPYLPATLDNLAITHGLAGDFAAARPLQDRALAIREKALGPDHPEVAHSLNNLGILLMDEGDFAGARPLFERALAIREKALGAENPGVGESLSNFAVVHERAGDIAGARPLYERALAVREKALGPDHPDVAETLNNLGNLLEGAGEYAKARPLFERALAIREKVLGPDHPEVAKSLGSLAGVFERTGDNTAARPLLERALAIRQIALGPDHPQVAQALAAVARVEAKQGDVKGALDRALAAERISREHLRATSPSLSERQALRYAAVRATGLDLALTLSASGLDGVSRRQALDALVRSRAVVLDEMAARHRAVGGTADPEVARLAEALASARVRLANLTVRGVGNQTPEAYRKNLDEAREEKERAERALGGESAGFARALSRSRLGLDEVGASLPARSALVSFREYRRIDLGSKGSPAGRSQGASYLAFVLRAGESAPRVLDLGPALEVDRLVGSVKSEIARGATGASEAEYRDAASRLRRRLWDPLAPALSGTERVFVVPDGSVNLVSIAALPREKGGYLVEQAPLVHYLSAERDLVPSGEPGSGAGLLVLGAPSYDAKSLFASLKEKDAPVVVASAATYRGERAACGDFATLRFAALPATGTEASEIATLWRSHAARTDPGCCDVRDLRGDAASETEVKRSAPGRRVVHLATHGFFLGGACSSALDATRGIGGLAQEPVVDEPEEAPPVTGENPLLLSGLALAGANHRSAAGPLEDDGILTAEEIASLDLTGVEWVVLSACETGVGAVRAGEGVFGLRRAVEVAGGRTLILSLWSAEDEATRAWMKALYEARLEAGLDTPESVRRATLAALEERRRKRQSTHPFHWGAFVAAGDWR